VDNRKKSDIRLPAVMARQWLAIVMTFKDQTIDFLL